MVSYGRVSKGFFTGNNMQPRFILIIKRKQYSVWKISLHCVSKTKLTEYKISLLATPYNLLIKQCRANFLIEPNQLGVLFIIQCHLLR